MIPLLFACAPAPTGHGHDHGPGGGAEHADEGVSVAITRWTATHELFVELDAPVAGQRFAYHAHVTRLADNHAATEGTLTLRFEQDGFPAESHTDPAIARPGIFAAEANAPRAPGSYTLVVSYANGEERASWAGGSVVVGAGAPVPHAPEPEGEIGFLKESQWQVPFAVAPATVRPLAPTLRAAGVVRAAPETTTVVAAPVDGVLVWADDPPVVGRAVLRGQRLATLVPAGQTDSWSRLQADVTGARSDRQLAAQELARVEGLVAQELLPGRRLEEARARLAVAEAEQSASARQMGALTGGAGAGVPVLAPADGLILAVGASHGERVGAGTPLVTVASGPGVLIEARVHDRARVDLGPARSISVDRGGWEQPADVLALGGRLLTERLVFDPHALSAPLTVELPAGAGLEPGDLVELELGVGEPTPREVVPRGAIVEVNGVDLVFVQRTGESFSRRRVVLGERDATHVEVLSGVEPGEMVVVEGGFDVHVASLSGALESHTH